jgi:hypothetical protein
VLIMPGASGQQPGDMALFDNLRVYRIPQE